MVAENNDLSFFQLFQYCLGSGLGTIGDFSSEQLLHDPKIYCDFLSSSCCERLPNPLKAQESASPFVYTRERYLSSYETVSEWQTRKLRVVLLSYKSGPVFTDVAVKKVGDQVLLIR